MREKPARQTSFSRSRFKAQSGPQSALRPLDGSTEPSSRARSEGLAEVCDPTGAICDLLSLSFRVW